MENSTMLAFALVFLGLMFLFSGGIDWAFGCMVIALLLFAFKPFKGAYENVVGEMEEADGSTPSKEVLEEGLKNAGEIVAGHGIDNEKPTNFKDLTVSRWKFRPKKIGEAAKKTRENFKKAFGE